jgi:protein SCO1/2
MYLYRGNKQLRSVMQRVVLIGLLALCTAVPARAQGTTPDDLLNQVGFDQRLEAQVPLDLLFRDEAGKDVRLGDYFGARPVILTLNYFECPNLCTLVLTGLADGLRSMSLQIGREFDVVSLSIDPREKPELAAAKKATYLERYGQPGGEGGWHFLTGDQASITQLTQAVGFRYAYDAQQNQFAHPAGIVILTPQGKIARYFYGIEYAPRDLRLGLVEASAGQIGTPIDAVLLRCYHYDPVAGRYTVTIENIVRLASVITALMVGLTLLALFRRERRRVLSLERLRTS